VYKSAVGCVECTRQVRLPEAANGRRTAGERAEDGSEESWRITSHDRGSAAGRACWTLRMMRAFKLSIIEFE
jgi:hypothetical protein